MRNLAWITDQKLAIAALLCAASAGVAFAPLLISSASSQPVSPETTRQRGLLTPANLRAHACGAPEAAPTTGGAMPLVKGLAPIHYPIWTENPETQRYFDQGMALLYGFEYPKAERSFAAGLARDPGCAMCLWGEALAIGPYLNSGPVKPAQIALAWQDTQQALSAGRLTPPEHALVEALALRYLAPPASEKSGANAVAFAQAMRGVSQRWPEDDLIMVLAAEAAMDVVPWDYWEADGIKPKPWGGVALALLETVLARNPDQPEAEHLYIHLTEASATPGRAEAAADRLRTAAPASAHLVHMPSHTYYRIGRFRDAIAVNQAAIIADDAMASRLHESSAYYGYFRHHMHFIMSSAEQIGDATTAVNAANQLEAAIPVAQAAADPVWQERLATAMQTRTAFASSTAEVLAIREPDPRLIALRRIWFALRAEALGRAGRRQEALAELGRMAAEHPAPTANDGHSQLSAMSQITLAMANARIAEGSGDRSGAIAALQDAARIDAALAYAEPPIWHEPIAVALGGARLRQGNAAQAQEAFAIALRQRPGNAWALWGMAQAEKALGHAEAARKMAASFAHVWAGKPGFLTIERL